MSVFVRRANFELLSLFYRLRAQVDCRRIFEEETAAAGELQD